MLIDVDSAYDNILQRVQTGIYLVRNRFAVDREFQHDSMWYEFDFEWPEFQGDVDSRLKACRVRFESGSYFPDYGSCDSVEQFLTHKYANILRNSKNEFCVVFTLMRKEDYPDYRWHKNGPYIGLHKQEYEHLGNEPDIEEIYQFHIYRRK